MIQPEMDYADGYLAVFAFLNLLWERRDEAREDLADMLSAMSLLNDGKPADQGYIQDWDEALERATGRKRSTFTSVDIYKAMLSLLQIYDSTGADDEFKRLIVRLTAALSADGTPRDPGIWQDWISCVERAKANEVDAMLRLKK